jgi:hypothetical protein
VMLGAEVGAACTGGAANTGGLGGPTPSCGSPFALVRLLDARIPLGALGALALAAAVALGAGVVLGAGEVGVTSVGSTEGTAATAALVAAATFAFSFARPARTPTASPNITAAVSASPPASFHDVRDVRFGLLVPTGVVIGGTSAAGVIALGSAALSISPAAPSAHGLGALVRALVGSASLSPP